MTSDNQNPNTTPAAAKPIDGQPYPPLLVAVRLSGTGAVLAKSIEAAQVANPAYRLAAVHEQVDGNAGFATGFFVSVGIFVLQCLVYFGGPFNETTRSASQVAGRFVPCWELITSLGVGILACIAINMSSVGRHTLAVFALRGREHD